MFVCAQVDQMIKQMMEIHDSTYFSQYVKW